MGNDERTGFFRKRGCIGDELSWTEAARLLLLVLAVLWQGLVVACRFAGAP